MSSGQDIDATLDWTHRMILRALLLSLLVHALAFTGYWSAQKFGWNVGRLPAILLQLQEKLLRLSQPKFLAALAPAPPPREVPLMFVEVPPEAVAPEPPPEAKFYGAANTLAANPKTAKDTATPKMDGRQKEILKITENNRSKAQPLQPALPPPQPKPAPEQPERPEPKPRENRPPGDLAIAKPEDLKPRNTTGQADSEEAGQKRSRPRTLEEARQKNSLPGQPMKQDGGVRRTGTLSLDVKGTPFGQYDAEFIAAVQQRWHALLEQNSRHVPGRVVLEFRLHADGRITDMNQADCTVGELLGLVCQRAVLDPAPYRKWPIEMRRELRTDYREVRFTFHYLQSD